MAQTKAIPVTPVTVPLPPDPTPSRRNGHTGASQSQTTKVSSSRGTYDILDKNHRLSSAGKYPAKSWDSSSVLVQIIVR